MRLDDNRARRRRDHNNRPSAWSRTWRSLCNHRSAGRPRCNCRGRRGMDNLRCRARLRNNLAGRRWCGSRRRRLCRHRRRRRRRFCGFNRRCRLGNCVRMARFFLFLFFLGQNRLEHIAGLGYVRQIDFWRYGRSSIARISRTGVATARATRKMRTYLFRLILLQRAGVGFAGAHAEFCQNLKNLPALDFQLPREIVDTNLTHPPLFSNPIIPSQST